MPRKVASAFLTCVLSALAVSGFPATSVQAQAPEPDYRLEVGFTTRSTFGAPLIPPLLYEGFEVMFGVFVENVGSSSFHGEAAIAVRLKGDPTRAWPLPSQDVDLDVGKSLEVVFPFAPPAAGVYETTARFRADDRGVIWLLDSASTLEDSGEWPATTGDTTVQSRAAFYTLAGVIGAGIVVAGLVGYFLIRLRRRKPKAPVEAGTSTKSPVGVSAFLFRLPRIADTK